MKQLFKTVIFLIGSLEISAQNVGIGTTTPTAKLDVLSPSTIISRFNSTTNQGFISVTENGNPRAYMGSFSGAAEDVDMGTAASNLTGKLHLTIQSNPKLTIDNLGNVGVGTMSPTEKFDLSGSLKMTGEIKPNGLAGVAGQVLTSNGNGTMQWAQAQSSNQEDVNGNGSWGDCSVNNIDAFYPVGNADGDQTDYFGNSVAISGDYAIVGADSDNESGLGGNGSVTIFKRNVSTGAWQSQGKFINPNSQNGDSFGWSVAISGDYAIVGSPNDDEGGLDINGSATMFKRNITTGAWESQGKLINPNSDNYDLFGWSVAISGDYVIVGAPEDGEAGFNGTGSATIFKRNLSTGVWESQGKFINSNPANFDRFGWSVSISGDYAIVGAYNDDEDGNTDNGSVTIIKRNTSTGVWESQGKIMNPIFSSNSDQFGFSVAISGDYCIVGTPYKDQGMITNNGLATIFRRNTSTGAWDYHGKLSNSNSANGDFFGYSVAISGDYAVVGSPNDDEGNTDNGSVSIYKRYENVWRLIQKFSDPSSADDNFFGKSVSIDSTNRRFIIGEYGTQVGTGMAIFGKVK